MTDRELLEMAAKAAGIELTFEHDKPQRIEMFRGHLPNYEDWNPLTNDGDALRLAVKLNLNISIHNDATVVSYAHPRNVFRELNGTDKNAATRRAIVRAAAEIGKEMP